MRAVHDVIRLVKECIHCPNYLVKTARRFNEGHNVVAEKPHRVKLGSRQAGQT